MRINENNIESPFLDAFLGFVLRVAEVEGLGDWTLDLWSCKGEAVCEESKKIIRFGFCVNLFTTEHLFLHEVAHALCSTGYQDAKNWNDSYWHRRPWQEIFARLLMDHLPEWYSGYNFRRNDEHL
jgi:hypothetical protein